MLFQPYWMKKMAEPSKDFTSHKCLMSNVVVFHMGSTEYNGINKTLVK